MPAKIASIEPVAQAIARAASRRDFARAPERGRRLGRDRPGRPRAPRRHGARPQRPRPRRQGRRSASGPRRGRRGPTCRACPSRPASRARSGREPASRVGGARGRGPARRCGRASGSDRGRAWRSCRQPEPGLEPAQVASRGDGGQTQDVVAEELRRRVAGRPRRRPPGPRRAPRRASGRGRGAPPGRRSTRRRGGCRPCAARGRRTR